MLAVSSFQDETHFHREMEEPSRSTSLFSAEKGQTALVSRKKFWREIQMVGLDIMGMMDMGCISRNLMSLKDFAVYG